MITIERTRRILGKTSERMTDEQVQKTIDLLTTLVNEILDRWGKLIPEERKRWRKELY